MYPESRSAHTVNSENMYLSLSLEYKWGMGIDLIHCRTRKSTHRKLIHMNLHLHELDCCWKY